MLRKWISGERRAAQAGEEWVKMRDAAITAMTLRCARHKIPAADFKLIVRLRFKNQPKKLAQAVFTGFEAGMSGFEQEAHSKLRCDYPN